MNIICNRNIKETVAEAVLPLLTDDRKKKALDWMRKFHLRDIWRLQSDEDDISLIINKIVVMEDGTAQVHLIDGSVIPYTFPTFHPSKYKAKKQKVQKKKKKPTNKHTSKTPTGITECDNCGVAIQQNAGRKPQRFCCSECRNQWWNEHPDQVNRKAYYEITCRHCGKIITVYGNKHRKYCSHECYIADRFGM